MEAGSLDRFNTIVLSLGDWIEELKFQGYPTAARLLAMAVLDLRMTRHGISDAELKSLCEMIQIEPRGLNEGATQPFPRRELRSNAAKAARGRDATEGASQQHCATISRLTREPDPQ
jgi:hypothetical protein